MDKIEIIFLIIDIVEFFVIFFLAKALAKAVKEYNKKAILSISLGAVLTAHPKLLVVLIILAVLFFLTICELAYKTHYYNTREVIKKEKDISVPYELYHYDGQIVDGVEHKERSNENDEILIDDLSQDEVEDDEEETEEENPTEDE
ncbi:MAG: hypothetical protein J5666_07500 [Bacilli bacterium]|nr:hypothetical protein [Bacilli bacterium]